MAEEGMDFEQAGGVIVDYVEMKKQQLLKRQQEKMDDGEEKVAETPESIFEVVYYLVSSTIPT